MEDFFFFLTEERIRWTMKQRTIEKRKEGARSSTFARILLARLTVMSRYLRRFQTSRKIPRVRALPLMNVVVMCALVAARFPHCQRKIAPRTLSFFCLYIYISRCIFEEEIKLSRIESTRYKKTLFFFSFHFSLFFFFLNYLWRIEIYVISIDPLIVLVAL